MGPEVMLVVAEQEGQTVAAALNLVGSHCVYGRNWGSIGGKEFKNLHFEVCYYQVRRKLAG
jgi:predicted N-acyltransferase